MSDPRNVAHDKKVEQEKQHKAEAAEDKKPAAKPAAKAEPEAAPVAPPEDLEKSMAVLSKLKDMEFHSRGNIEKLAELILEIEDELKQTEFSKAIETLYGAQDKFHEGLAKLIADYEVKCDELKPSA